MSFSTLISTSISNQRTIGIGLCKPELKALVAPTSANQRSTIQPHLLPDPVQAPTRRVINVMRIAARMARTVERTVMRTLVSSGRLCFASQPRHPQS